MSEVEHQETDILLPGARIALFSTDAETRSSLEVLRDDWRYARVQIDAHDGDVETAIKSCEASGSPDLLIIQTDKIDDDFIGRLGALSEFCDEDTAAIIIGPVNDVYLYRQLIEMGVSDYLVRPVQPDVISGVIAKALVSRLGVAGSRLIAFVGAKGGVGVSSIAQTSAWISAEKLGQKTVLLDASGGWSSLSVGMGFDSSATLYEVSRAVENRNEDTLKRMFYEADENLTILATGSDAMLDPSLPSANYEAILDRLMSKSPIVMVDLSCSDSSLKKAVLSRANQIVLVTSPTVTSLRFSRSLIKEVSDVRGGDKEAISLVVNKKGAVKAFEVSEGDIKEALEFQPSAVIEHMPSLFLKYESEIKGLLSDKDGAAVFAELLPVLQKSIVVDMQSDEAEDKNSGLLGGFLNKLTTK
ncbi:MAG: AAA family ATPase [Alphaproteobacteria bacterium]